MLSLALAVIITIYKRHWTSKMKQTDGNSLSLTPKHRAFLSSILSRHVVYTHTSSDKVIAREILKEIQND